MGQIISQEDVMKQVKKYLKEKVDVTLYYNNECGNYQWAVTVASDPEFWLNAFQFKKNALRFCKRYNLKVVKVIK